MKERTCCFTGHRDIPQNEYAAIKKRLECEAENLINQGVIYYGAGGARGFDTLAAEVIIELRKKYPQIKLILVLPCEGQESMWSEADIAKYNRIKLQADKVKTISPRYYNGCMHARNHHLVDNSAYCICYLRKRTGGTAYTVKYACESGIGVVYV